VDSGLARLARPRRGHFDLGTGFHGDLWLDLDALFLRPALLSPWIRELAGRLREHRADAVCGPMEGGAFLALAIAGILETAFLPAYREGQGYRLAGVPGVPGVPGGISGWRVAIADDAVNAGTAVRACAGLLRGHGAVPVAVAALLAVGPASAAVPEVPCYAAAALDSHAWPEDGCPLCARGTPLSHPAQA
jgi:orotate phosphoribosyltransferase